MLTEFPISFPPEAEKLRREARELSNLTASERFNAAMDALNTCEALSLAGDCREQQLKFHEMLEEDWRRRITEIIEFHGIKVSRKS